MPIVMPGKGFVRSPDFIIIDVKGNPTFVEVKYRWDGLLHNEDLERFKKIKDFWNAKIIIVNSMKQPFFQIASPPYVKDSGDLIVKPLIKETSFKIDSVAYKEMEILVSKYLSTTLFPPLTDYPF